MKTKKKVLAIALVAAMIAIISLGSLAWFTDNDEVTNKFTVEQNFGIDVYETNAEGEKVAEGKVPTGLTFTDVMPGQSIHKDPTVKNTGDHAEWVRVSVTLTNAMKWSNILKAEENPIDLSDFFGGFVEDNWTRVDPPTLGMDWFNPSAGGSLTWVFYLNYTLGPGETATLFDNVTIPSSLTLEQAKQLAGGFDISIKAEAVQVENLGADNAVEAFALLG